MSPVQHPSGAVSPAPFALAADAQTAGLISERHVRVIAKAITTLPDGVQAELGEQLEAQLVEAALTLEPTQVVKVGRHVHDLLGNSTPCSTQVAVGERHRSRVLRGR